MCCFTGPVQSVKRTRIFARAAADGREFMAYEMAVEPAADLAMVLPVPVKPGSGEDALRFIDLTQSPRLFDEIEALFPQPPVPRSPVPEAAPPLAAAPEMLVVHQVGRFEASYVPTIADFARLDPRFRFPAALWDQLPGYRAYGFAVFKIKKGRHEAHPMAFSFPRADARSLYFPTFHIHDGAIHRTAHYDHVLYCQADPAVPLDLRGWTESERTADQRPRIAPYPPTAPRAPGAPPVPNPAEALFDPPGHAYKRVVAGEFQNLDVVLRAV